MKCSQTKCVEKATYSYVWPGRPERTYACRWCLAKARGIALAMGFELGDVREEPVNKEEKL